MQQSTEMAVVNKLANGPHLLKWFQAADDNKSNRLTGKELNNILTEQVQLHNFSLEQCVALICLFSDENSITLDFKQFEQVFDFLLKWRLAFEKYDTDHSQAIDKKELNNAFVHMGYHLTDMTVKAIFNKYNKSTSNKKMTFESFVSACVHLHKITIAHKAKDPSNTGRVRYSYDDIIGFAMSNTT